MRPLLKSNQTTNIRLVLIVLIVDLITCGTLLIEAIAGFIRPDYLFEVPTLCKLAHLFAGGSTFCSIWFLAIVSFERYTHIVLEKTLKNIFWYLIMGVVSCFYIGTSIYSMVEDSIRPNELGVYCFVDSKKAEGKVLFYIVTILNITSIITVVFSYISIAKATLKMKNKAKVSNPERVTDLDRTVTLAFLKIFGIVAFYLITNTFETYLQVYEIFTDSKRSPMMDVISTALINSNPVVNSILLLLINKEVGNRFYGKFLYKEIELTTTNISNLP
ncbi:family A G protein-coupled receptor-like protein [Conidiobolus coronatus NRRL 28638]|uniref:Family A G protein-coupled receptor-like protein n=1 Tax=Conidiobolus coronatus (strain ATCC 28846 / CBS 209.66 / NRRL 28638) TaxID=796925 RepID=A0A137NY58_CONC2|nr:family A G protein-coupled receptor-like protein [Conidiobolus coronatus NRRL 28638]|eukprot:KXN67687.1 family A G protein-coupled receptor-like protein [Conidiobolus coronatus NRRL 28638]